MDEIVQRIVTLRETDDPPSFSEIAGVLTTEYPELLFTKDKVRGIYQRNKTAAPPDTRRVVVLGDVHSAPHKDLLKMVIDTQPDLIVVAGDLLDSAALSTHGLSANERRLTLKQEISICREYLQSLSDSTAAEILVMMGNHDHRWQREASKFLPAEVLEIVGSPLEAVVTGIPRVSLASTMLSLRNKQVSETPYLLQIGDAIISHMNFTSKNPGGAVTKLYGWMREWLRVLKLGDIRLYIQAHGHKCATVYVEGGEVLLVEPGAAGDAPMDEYKLKYEPKWSPSHPGVCMFQQTQRGNLWVTDLTSFRLLRALM